MIEESVVSRVTDATLDVAVTAAYASAGTAVSYSTASVSVVLWNRSFRRVDDLWYKVDSGAWVRLPFDSQKVIEIDFSTQTLTLKRGEVAAASLPVRLEIAGVPSGLYARGKALAGSLTALAALGVYPSSVDSPLDIADCALWLDASDATTIAGSPANNDPVSTWADKSGNGYNAAQATGINQPVYKTNIQNSKPVIRFTNAVNPQYLSLSGAALGLLRNLDGCTIAAAGGNVTSGLDYLFEASQGADTFAQRAAHEIINFVANGPDDSGLATAGVDALLSRITCAVFVVNFTGGAMAVYPSPTAALGTIDILQKAKSADTDSLRIVIGSDLGLNGSKLDCGELIVYDRALNATECRRVLSYLSDKWGTL